MAYFYSLVQKLVESKSRAVSCEDLNEWLETYSLGDLWSKGEIGGNRW
jgi:hypothetical protein